MPSCEMSLNGLETIPTSHASTSMRRRRAAAKAYGRHGSPSRSRSRQHISLSGQGNTFVVIAWQALFASNTLANSRRRVGRGEEATRHQETPFMGLRSDFAPQAPSRAPEWGWWCRGARGYPYAALRQLGCAWKRSGDGLYVIGHEKALRTRCVHDRCYVPWPHHARSLPRSGHATALPLRASPD